MARGNEGVAGRIKRSWGPIGYVEYGFAKRLGLPMVYLQNKAGHYVEPGPQSGQAALAANVNQVPSNLRLFHRSRRRRLVSNHHLNLVAVAQPLCRTTKKRWR